MRPVWLGLRHLALVAMSLGAIAGCSLPAPSAPSAAGAAAADYHEAAAYCVSEINRLRADVGLPPFTHAQDIEDFSTEAARVDGEAHEVHKHFYATHGGNGVSRAQNEIPWWSLSRYGSVREVIRQGVQIEWNEGPGGYHYQALTGSYSYVGCGIANLNGEVTVTHDFR